MGMLLPCLCLFLGFFVYIYSNGAAPCDFNPIFFGFQGMISASCSFVA
jgi:hypothetical protein